MSENQPEEANDRELEQVAGGNTHYSSIEQLKRRDQFTKLNEPIDLASALIKKINETQYEILRKIS